MNIAVKKILLTVGVSLGIEFAILPLWIFDTEAVINLAPLQFLVGLCIAPVYLAVITSSFNFKNQKFPIAFDIAVSIVSLVFISGLGYLWWGLFSSDLFCPDGETLALVQLEFGVGICMFLAFYFIINTVILIKARNTLQIQTEETSENTDSKF